jgi:hypothetical protein
MSNSNSDSLYNFDTTDTTKKEPTKQIQYDYYNNTIKKSDTKSTYSGKENSPNIYIFNSNNKQSFISENVYVFKNTSNTINNNPYGVEVIIVNKPVTNGNKLFLRIPIIIDTNVTPNKLSDFINQQKNKKDKYDDITINLNTILSQSDECIFYETKEKTTGNTSNVVLFTTPIKLNITNTNITSKQILLDDTDADKDAYKTFNITQNSTEVGQWMECDNVPLDYSEEIPSYNVTIDSKIFKKSSELFMIAMHFLLFIVTISFVYFVIPPIYSLLAARSLYKLGSDKELGRISGMEIAVSLLLIIPMIAYIWYGASLSNTNEKYNYITTGVYIGLFWILSWGIITIKKITNPNLIDKFNFDKDKLFDFIGGLKNMKKSVISILKSFTAEANQ